MEIKADKRKNKYWKVSQEIIDKILVRIENGSTRKHAAESNFVSERHFYYILAQGVVDIENNIFDSQGARLVQRLREIEANEIETCRQLTRQSEKGHRGAEWTLEHAYWKHFGKDVAAKALAEEIQNLRMDLKKGKSADEEVDEED